MKGLLIRWVVSAISLYLTALIAKVLGIGIELNGFFPAVLVVAMLAVVNALIRPLLVLLTLPLNCLTLGLFTFIINALMFWLAGSIFKGFQVEGFLPAVFGSVVMGLISGLANYFIAPNKDET